MKPKSAKKSEAHVSLPVVSRLEQEPVCAGFRALMRRLRLAAGLSFRALEGLTGLSRRFLAMVEQGLRLPTLDSVSRIAHGLGMEPDVMLREARVV